MAIFVYRFGLFTLKTVYEGRPAYIHTVTGQAFFYKSEFDKWDYWHKLERWIIGNELGNAVGGIMIMSSEVCPWDINFKRSDVYFYFKKHFNAWNPKGNGWKLENQLDIRFLLILTMTDDMMKI